MYEDILNNARQQLHVSNTKIMSKHLLIQLISGRPSDLNQLYFDKL